MNERDVGESSLERRRRLRGPVAQRFREGVERNHLAVGRRALVELRVDRCQGRVVRLRIRAALSDRDVLLEQGESRGQRRGRARIGAAAERLEKGVSTHRGHQLEEH